MLTINMNASICNLEEEKKNSNKIFSLLILFKLNDGWFACGRLSVSVTATFQLTQALCLLLKF